MRDRELIGSIYSVSRHKSPICTKYNIFDIFYKRQDDGNLLFLYSQLKLLMNELYNYSLDKSNAVDNVLVLELENGLDFGGFEDRFPAICRLFKEFENNDVILGDRTNFKTTMKEVLERLKVLGISPSIIKERQNKRVPTSHEYSFLPK